MPKPVIIEVGSVGPPAGYITEAQIDAKVVNAVAAEPTVTAAAAAAVDAEPRISRLTSRTLDSRDYPDLQAFLNAVSSTKTPGRIHPGTYTVMASLAVGSNSTVYMDGATLRYGTNTTLTGILDIDGAENVTIRGGILDGNVTAQSVWSEYRHGVRIRASRNVRLEGVTFLDPVGDAVYISHLAGDTAPYEGSADVWVERCLFTGQHKNRNGISIICAERIHIKHNTFLGMTRVGMPGSIDLEPDNPDQYVRDVEISGNLIDGLRLGVIASYGICVANHIAGTENMAGINVHHNHVTGDVANGVYLIGHATATERGIAATANHIHDLATTGTVRGVFVSNMDAEVSGNQIDNVPTRAIEQAGTSTVTGRGNTISRTNTAVYVSTTTATGHYSDNDIAVTGANSTGFAVNGNSGEYSDNRIRDAVFGFYMGTGVQGNWLFDNRMTSVGTAAAWAGGRHVSNLVRNTG